MVKIKLENIADLSTGAYHGAAGSLKKDVATLLRLYTPRKREHIMMKEEEKVPATICGVAGEALGILGYKTSVAVATVYGAYNLIEKIVSQ